MAARTQAHSRASPTGVPAGRLLRQPPRVRFMPGLPLGRTHMLGQHGAHGGAPVRENGFIEGGPRDG